MRLYKAPSKRIYFEREVRFLAIQTISSSKNYSGEAFNNGIYLSFPKGNKRMSNLKWHAIDEINFAETSLSAIA
ncbi:MAG: hypothetical protein PUP93_33820 [Rhizonema sp. NSF051]|nr:hypothetical protein [Rhizonema sp. NSF051]